VIHKIGPGLTREVLPNTDRPDTGKLGANFITYKEDFLTAYLLIINLGGSMKFLAQYIVAGLVMTACCKLLGVHVLGIAVGWCLLPVYFIAVSKNGL